MGADTEAGRLRYAAPTDLGPFAVGHTVFEATDAARDGRTLRVEMWYPAEETAEGDPTFYDFQFFGLGLTSPVSIEDAPVTGFVGLPLVVFSHGNCGVSFQSTPLMEMLASHGFFVVAPNHTGNSVNECIGTSGPDPFEVSARNRPLDVSFLIDLLTARSRDPADPLYARINERQIGVAGHSFGGYTALAMASGIEDASLGDAIPPDRRVRAIAPIAPASRFFDDAELAGIAVPTLLLVGSEDSTTPVDDNVTRPWALIGASAVYRAEIVGAEHLHFANACDIAQALSDFGVSESGIARLVPGYFETCGAGAFPIADARRIANLYVTAFFKRHLLDDRRYDDFLTTGYAAANEPDVAFQRKDEPR
ncbi:MAG: hypothetical protein DCC71_16310 [Proteobacteria bacterium]|nr:MAG: hypothetical protein DCC71_16310 [Pseudomonadota bacterium]